MTKVAILAIPFLTTDQHRKDAERAMASVKSSFVLDRIAVVNRHRPEGDDLEWIGNNFDLVIQNDANIVARAWNRGIAEALSRGNRYVVVMNLDVVLRSDCIDNLVHFAKSNPKPLLWSAHAITDPSLWNDASAKPAQLEEAHFSLFMVDERLFQTVGEFDERFVPAYFEDCDMRRRIQLTRGIAIGTAGALFFHEQSGTMIGAKDHDHNFLVELNDGLVRNKEYYIEKWGGEPGHETYIQPFGK